MKKSGIYKITNRINGKFYIGSAVDIKNRFSTHVSELKNKTHSNYHLQRAWDKYGKENFIFEVLEEIIDINSLLLREQHFLDILTPEYNICKIASSTLGIKYSEDAKKRISENHADVSGERNPMYGKKGHLAPAYGKKLTNATKQKIREAIGNRQNEKNPMYGKKHSAETIELMRKKAKKRINPMSKLDWGKAREIRQLHESGNTTKSLSKKYDVSCTTIYLLINKKIWKEETNVV
jgi:group I intron endonuclease